MPDKCFVKNCKRGNGEKVAMFYPPIAEALLHKWKKALQGLTKKEDIFDGDSVESFHVISVDDGVQLHQQ